MKSLSTNLPEIGSKIKLLKDDNGWGVKAGDILEVYEHWEYVFSARCKVSNLGVNVWVSLRREGETWERIKTKKKIG